MDQELEFQISEIFPSLIIKKDISDCITDDILSTFDNIVENMSEKVPLSESFSSRREMNSILDLPAFEDLKDHLVKSILQFCLQQYQVNRLDLVESFAIHIPKDGYYEIRKNYNCTFNLLINLTSSSNIVLHNPIYLTKPLDYDVQIANKYNSQYSFIPFNQYEAMIIPSGIYYGFPKREEELKLITSIIR
jgi:hypothetical protein